MLDQRHRVLLLQASDFRAQASILSASSSRPQPLPPQQVRWARLGARHALKIPRTSASGFRLQASGFSLQVSGFRLQERIQGSGFRLQASGFKQGFRLQASGCRLQASGFRVQERV